MNGSEGRSGGISFSHLLRGLRRNAGLSQEELAELAGLSARTVGNLERCLDSRPRRRSLEQLATALGLDVQIRAEFLAVGWSKAHMPVNGHAASEIGLATAPAEQAGESHQPAALCSEPVLGPAERDEPVALTPGAALATRTLPRDSGGFTGRQPELACLVGALEDAGAAAAVPAAEPAPRQRD